MAKKEVIVEPTKKKTRKATNAEPTQTTEKFAAAEAPEAKAEIVKPAAPSAAISAPTEAPRKEAAQATSQPQTSQQTSAPTPIPRLEESALTAPTASHPSSR